VSDGRQLVFLRSDGNERRVLTEAGAWEFDPAYAPNGARLAFARADATTGAGLGIWTWEVGGGAPTRVEPPDDLLDDDPSPDPEASGTLRAPRYAPDGQALAFVDVSAGSIGMLELPAARYTRIAFAAAAAPIWLPDSSGVLVAGDPDAGGAGPGARLRSPIRPLAPGAGHEVFRIGRSATTIAETVFATGWRVLAVAPDGTIAFADAEGDLGITDSLTSLGTERLVEGEPVVGAAFAPHERTLAIAVEGADGTVRIEQLDLRSGHRELLAESGERPRWQP
jgi:hypothetical protein